MHSIPACLASLVAGWLALSDVACVGYVGRCSTSPRRQCHRVTMSTRPSCTSPRPSTRCTSTRASACGAPECVLPTSETRGRHPWEASVAASYSSGADIRVKQQETQQTLSTLVHHTRSIRLQRPPPAALGCMLCTACHLPRMPLHDGVAADQIGHGLGSIGIKGPTASTCTCQLILGRLTRRGAILHVFQLRRLPRGTPRGAHDVVAC